MRLPKPVVQQEKATLNSTQDRYSRVEALETALPRVRDPALVSLKPIPSWIPCGKSLASRC
jgi:hypothetical protein